MREEEGCTLPGSGTIPGTLSQQKERDAMCGPQTSAVNTESLSRTQRITTPKVLCGQSTGTMASPSSGTHPQTLIRALQAQEATEWGRDSGPALVTCQLLAFIRQDCRTLKPSKVSTSASPEDDPEEDCSPDLETRQPRISSSIFLGAYVREDGSLRAGKAAIFHKQLKSTAVPTVKL